MKNTVLIIISTILCSVVAKKTCKPAVCEPNTRFTRDCNTCICTKDGNIACTERYCPPTDKPDRPQVCKPGSSFPQDCNTCVCNEDGTAAACTLRACIHPTKP